MSAILLFCFPYAGGSSAVYNQWQKCLHKTNIHLKPIELAGRGGRIAEPLYANVELLIDDVFKKIAKDITEGPFAFFGHSMGAMIAYELYQKLRIQAVQLPSYVFFSGRKAPHSDGINKNVIS